MPYIPDHQNTEQLYNIHGTINRASVYNATKNIKYQQNGATAATGDVVVSLVDAVRAAARNSLSLLRLPLFFFFFCFSLATLVAAAAIQLRYTAAAEYSTCTTEL